MKDVRIKLNNFLKCFKIDSKDYLLKHSSQHVKQSGALMEREEIYETDTYYYVSCR